MHDGADSHPRWPLIGEVIGGSSFTALYQEYPPILGSNLQCFASGGGNGTVGIFEAPSGSMDVACFSHEQYLDLPETEGGNHGDFNGDGFYDYIAPVFDRG